MALKCAAQFVLMPKFEARSFIEAVAEHRCTMISGIPTMLAMVAQQTDLLVKLDLSCVRVVSIGSAPLTESLLERIKTLFPNASVSNGYGTTEVGPAIFGAHPAGLPRPAMSVGFPLQGVECRLVGGLTPQEGVLEVKSPAAFREYLNLPEQTARRRHDGWCVTGDVMRRDENGFFFFVGRDDDMFVCGGENLYPGDIERLIERHPAVLQAAVVAVDDEVKGAIPIAFVVGVPGAILSTDEVKAFTLREGPAYAHPRAVILLDQIPMASTHKVDKRALMPQAIDAAAARRR
jgi:acyl-CoA synthetase (AMP-forming)/AMP-acid ligase II